MPAVPVVACFLYSCQISCIKIIDFSFDVSIDLPDAKHALPLFKTSLGYIDFIKQRLQVIFVGLINNEEELYINGVKYVFLKGRTNIWRFMPLRLMRYIKKEKADILFMQGLGFPLQVILLRLWLGKRPKFIVQHHGERPLAGMAGRLQKIADKCIDAYFFTSAGNGTPWIEKKLIGSAAKCYEVLEASTYITKQDKQQSRQMLGITGDANILWVGRLEQNKDPLTVLYGFEKYLRRNPTARLYMVYQEDILLNETKNIISKNEPLKTAVVLVGRVEHEKLAYWYSAADFYISGSHREGSGYALIEAMACGCIPVVTNIPPYRAITNNGECAILYQKGDSNNLLEALIAAENIDKAAFSDRVARHFTQKLSFQAIADDIYTICMRLTGKQMHD